MNRVKCGQCGRINPPGNTACNQCGALLPSVRVNVQRQQTAADQPGMEQVAFRRGQVIANRFHVLEMIGRGGMGCIYKVHDTVLNEEMALKTLLPQYVRDKLVVDRFYNEARIARSLSHPSIIRVHDIGMAGNILYISMELLQGQSLRAMLDNLAPGQRSPIRTTLRIIDELCAALEYAHQFTVHRDIKPENIMITHEGHVKLMDFGISKLVRHTQLTGTSVVMGTPHYMSPEQLKDSSMVDARADIYSIGVVLYEMLTGNLPTGVPKSASQLRGEVPPALDPVISKCLEPDPKDRFQSIQELRHALRPVRELVEGNAPLPSYQDMQGASYGRRTGESSRDTGRRVAGVLLALIIVALAGAGIWGIENRPAKSVETEQELGAAEPLADQEGRALYDSLSRLCSRARIAAQLKSESGDSLGFMIESGDSKAELAQESAEAGQYKQAAFLARQALQFYGAPVMRPEGMVFVPPGPITLHSEAGSCEVMVDGFFIDRYEVTNRQFQDFAENVELSGETGIEGGWRIPAGLNPNEPDVPVTNVTFYDAMAYAAYHGKRLPTEAEWARAAYGAKDASPIFPWGEDWEEGAANLGIQDHYGGKAPAGQHAKDVSPYGCMDMLGNVSEWTRSIFMANPCNSPQDAAGRAPYFGSLMVVRGGNYTMQRPPWLSMRMRMPYEDKGDYLGFRCVKPFPQDLATIRTALAAQSGS